jgi:DNA-binding MarR family transcriptional regulator
MNTSISEKEFAVISEISNSNLPNQRIIARKLGISLGLTNLIINRLVKMGYVKVKQLDRRKIQYILTPKGFSEKTKKSYNYALRTINTLTVIREKIQNLVIDKYKTGVRDFLIVGDNELADLAEISLKKISVPNVSYLREMKNGKVSNENKFVLYTTNNKANGNSINLISYLAEVGLKI